jgi:hypothetical protein
VVPLFLYPALRHTLEDNQSLPACWPEAAPRTAVLGRMFAMGLRFGRIRRPRYALRHLYLTVAVPFLSFGEIHSARSLYRSQRPALLASRPRDCSLYPCFRRLFRPEHPAVRFVTN